MHSKVYYDLVERKMVDYVLAADGNGGSATASGGTIAPTYAGGNDTVPTYCGLRVTPVVLLVAWVTVPPVVGPANLPALTSNKLGMI